MEEEAAAAAAAGVEVVALRSLGLGFDLACDFRLRFAKPFPGDGGGRLVQLDERDTHDIPFPGGPTIPGVSRDIGCDKGDRTRFRSDVLEFNQMSELLNQKSSVQGKVPSGYFNTLFDLSGTWLADAKETKCLAFDGYFISLYNLHLRASPLVLRDEVKRAVPPKWDPVALSRFIRTYGTHIIVEVAVGGQDVVCVRQSHSSTISSAELKIHLEDLGDFLFSDGRSLSPIHRKTREGKNKVPEVFHRILQSNNLQLAMYTETSNKDVSVTDHFYPKSFIPPGLTVICSKRGGNVYLSNHSQWLQTVSSNPDAILLKFVPITSLLTGVPGSGYLSHAINLYLRYKPDLEDLQYFLEFQVPLQWAPMFNELALGPQKRKASYPTLQFRFLGPKLHVSTTQVSSSQKPVVGLRLYLEGRKCNRLAIHVQHLSSIPSMLSSTLSSSMSQWQGSEESDSNYFEPVQWTRYSCICTSVVKHNTEWLQRFPDSVFVVTGAQLVAKGNWAKKGFWSFGNLYPRPILHPPPLPLPPERGPYAAAVAAGRRRKGSNFFFFFFLFSSLSLYLFLFGALKGALARDSILASLSVGDHHRRHPRPQTTLLLWCLVSPRPWEPPPTKTSLRALCGLGAQLGRRPSAALPWSNAAGPEGPTIAALSLLEPPLGHTLMP
ncbi:MACPF domain-containing protein [Ananas comosus]|uniref:MACPF domain-containing protein n=1 Tax=Ananas comosus TaxID=4615 RepID=A0A199VPT6_ANACO|nr:MACPF domain-containing protein [Ananas comosus]